jgi:2-C-methyl-D-erythritol 2,4-cyclodiphosphate synthase
MSEMRIGHGYDVHALVPGRRLVLGGVDIGTLFPDTDAKFKDADSRELLRRAMARVTDGGWRVINVDSTVVAQRPKIAPHVAAMRRNVAQCLGIDEVAVNVKGKTTEHLGFAGRGEGIAAHAVVLLGRV